MGSHMMVPIYFTWTICAAAFLMMAGARPNPNLSPSSNSSPNPTNPNPYRPSAPPDQGALLCRPNTCC